MLVVTSILSGEFTTTQSPRRKNGSCKKKKQLRNTPSCQRSLAPSSERSDTAASLLWDEDREPDYSENNTTLKGDDGCDTATEAFSSAGSTCLGDSFVLAIDWNTTTANVGPSYYHDTATGTVANHGLNESLDDPYLQPVETMRRNLCVEESPDAPLLTCITVTRPARSENAAIRSVRRILGGSATKTPKRTLKQKLLSPLPQSTMHVSPSAKSLGSFAMPSQEDQQSPAKSIGSFKSLGSFVFPADSDFETTADEEEENCDANRPSASVTVPRLARFDPPVFTLLDDDEEENDADDSFSIPSTRVLIKPAARSRKRRHAALQRVVELKADLQQHRKQFACGRKQLQTAKLYLQLGTTEQQARLYPAAINSFFQAAAIYRHFSLAAALATALDHAAVAYCQAHQEGLMTQIQRQHKVSRFYRCLHEALQLRKQELGPWHVDTVDTLQHLAQLCLLTGHPARAAGHYLEVVHLRKSIFGPNHPGTAVTAHCLGNAYLQSHDTAAAELWYDHALAIYNSMQLPNDNPAVAKLLRDRKRLERVDRWMEDDPASDENLLFEL